MMDTHATSSLPDHGDDTYLAAVDLGSNSFHMIVAREVGGELRIVDRIKEMVRLSADLNDAGELPEPARRRAIQCLARFGQRLRSVAPQRVRVVGTSTLRRARNSEDFQADVESALGVPVDVINGREEARLIYLGVAHSRTDEGRRLVMDIGGGSTELIIGEQLQVIVAESLEMGCVNTTQRYFPDGVIDRKRMRAAQTMARVEVEPLEDAYRRHGWATALGASGTIKTVAAVLRHGRGRDVPWFDLDSLTELEEEVIDAGHIDRLDFHGLSPERRPVFVGGLAILLGVFKQLTLDRMQPSDMALREGVLYDLLGRLHHDDIRERTVMAFCRRYGVDNIHGANVEQTACTLFERYRVGYPRVEENHNRLLRWAARLHEIGLSVSHSKYHKHGDYLIRYSDMPGFSNREQRSLAGLLRHHRRSLDVNIFSELVHREDLSMIHLTLILRLAVLLNRARSGPPAGDMNLRIGRRTVKLTVESDWLEGHPLTEADLHQEKKYLEDAGFRLKIACQSSSPPRAV